ncbi:MAG: Polypeptide release factor (eRF1) in translation termination [Stictis urceolatum]|nr:Polypeptide release factor (eRF1) in translation termination [Stictis urceolata]
MVSFCMGAKITSEGKELMLNMDFMPYKPLRTSLYLCNNKFHTEAISDLLQDDARFSFIVVEGNGALFAAVSGNIRDILAKISVDLPKKHGRGGQSALRLARLQVAETAVTCFINNNNTANVQGLVLAGFAYLKSELNSSDLLDPRLKEKAIDLAAHALSDVNFVQEKQLLEKYFLAGAIDQLIVYESLETIRWSFQPSDPQKPTIVVHTMSDDSDRTNFMDADTWQEMEIAKQMPLLEWFVEVHQQFGATLQFVSNRSGEGHQFVQGFGGVGAILRYVLNLEQLAEISEDEYEHD